MAMHGPIFNEPFHISCVVIPLSPDSCPNHISQVVMMLTGRCMQEVLQVREQGVVGLPAISRASTGCEKVPGDVHHLATSWANLC